MAKRGAGEGTIYKRPNGTWSAQVTINGRRISKYGKTRREVAAWLDRVKAQYEQGLLPVPHQITLAQYLDHWLDISRQSLRPKTWDQYRSTIENHIAPVLGRLKLKSIRPDHIQALYNDKIAAGTGVRTVQIIHAILHKSLGQAVRWQFLTRNPAAAVQKPKPAKREMKTLNIDQVKTLLEAATASRYYALFYLALATGLRQGEVLGLRWSDLDWDTGILQIQRQLQRVPNQGTDGGHPSSLQFNQPKTAAGRRSVNLSAADLDILRAHRKRQLEERLFFGSEWHDQELLFPSTRGTPTEPRNLLREFKRLLKVAGLPVLRFHDLRHTAATLMLQQGIHPKIVQERLGHSDITLTLNTYSHVVPSMQKEAADKISALLS